MSFKNISELFLRKRIISKAALDYFKEKENSKSLSSNLFQKRKIPITSLREAIKKKVNKKRREGVGPNPHFYIRITWDPTLREGGSKLLFPKSKFHLVFVLGVISKFYSDLSLKNKENFCFSCRIFGDLLLQRTNLQ